MTKSVPVNVVGAHPTIRYAGEELVRCLTRMGLSASCNSVEQYDPSGKGLWIGPSSVFPNVDVPDVPDMRMDDAVFVGVTDGHGVITGSNPRSVLLAVYRYLRELGCRWVRPGPDGEFIPESPPSLTCHIVERPAYRHRGMCIEGAVSEEHVRNMVEWLPRVGMNAYFTQFRESYAFFHRWYSRQGNPLQSGEVFTIEQARAILKRVVADIKKRDLLYHAVGHGWTCEPFGLKGLGWELEPVEAPAEVAPYLAMVNGKRHVWEGIPINTNLCYSNPEVRRIMVDDMVRYVKEHPEVDLLHVWLADGANNNCECEDCVQARPSDFYVMILNALDNALTQAGLTTRVVFLIYVDLLWPPEREVIAHPERFVLMFAPITRSYSKPLDVDLGRLPELPAFERNRLQFPRSVEANVAFLKAWEPAFKGDSFDFDYHFMWDHYNDPGYTSVAAVLYEDIRSLRSIGLNGFVSCQTQRAFLPTGLGIYAMAMALWDPNTPYRKVEEDYYRAAFGPDWTLARGYLYELTELFGPASLRGDMKPDRLSANVNCDRGAGFDKVPDLIAAYRPVIAHHAESNHPVWSASWNYLLHHADIIEPLARAYDAQHEGDSALAHRLWLQAVRTAWEREPDIHSVLDVWLFQRTLSSRFPSQ